MPIELGPRPVEPMPLDDELDAAASEAERGS
jgi:hypothetical protein